MAIKNTQSVKKVIDAIVANGGWWDGHDPSGKTFVTFNEHSHWKLVSLEGEICPVLDNNVVCLNPIRLDRGKPVLSRWSIGGNINCRHQSLPAAVHQYNNELMWDGKSREEKLYLLPL